MFLVNFFYAVLTSKSIVESQFKPAPGFEYLDPILGAVAHQKLIYNIRFFGNCIRAFKDGQREYILDTSTTDPVWNLVKILFPSPAGELSTVAVAKSSFGYFIKDPEVVSILLNFTQTARALLEPLGQEALSEPEFEKKKIAIMAETIANTVADIASKAIPQNDLVIRKGVIREVLKCIINAFTHETELGYPKYTTEQVILAFLWGHFDDQVGRSDVGTPPAEASTLNIMLSKLNNTVPRNNEPLSPYQNYVVTIEDSGITPYKNQVPIGHAFAQRYDRIRNETFSTFSDCTEITIRHLLNLLLYLPDGGYKKTNNPEINQFFSKLKNANVGSLIPRTDFNKIVADLNSDGIHRMDYLRQDLRPQGGTPIENELNPSMLNLMRLFNYLFDLGLTERISALYEYCQSQEVGADTSDKKEEVERLFRDIFQLINPDKQFTVNITGLKIGKRETSDFYGDMKIGIQTKGQPQIYAYASFSKSHAVLTKIDDPTIKTPRYQLDYQNFPYPIYESLLLYTGRYSTIPIYALFKNPIFDTVAQSEYLGAWRNNFYLIPKIWLQSLSNVLSDLQYDNAVGRKQFSSILLGLMQKNDAQLNAILYQHVAGLRVDLVAPNMRIDQLLNFENLKYLDIPLTPEVINKLSDFKSLKDLKIIGECEDITLRNIHTIENLSLDRDAKIKKLQITECSNLKNVDFRESSKTDTIILSSLPNCEHLLLPAISKLLCMHLKRLKTLSVQNAESIFLHNLPALEHCTIESLKDRLTLKGKFKTSLIKELQEKFTPKIEMNNVTEVND